MKFRLSLNSRLQLPSLACGNIPGYCGLCYMLGIVTNLLVSMRKSKLPWSYLYKRFQAIPVPWRESS